MIWKCGDKNIEYGKKTLIMAIINVTPDSFSDGGDSFNPENAIENAVKAQNAGADIIDFGAQSTRPGYTPISDDEEWERLEPVLKGIRVKITVPVSIDTFFPSVALRAAKLGANIINDVSGYVSKDKPLFALHVRGESMLNAGILDGDIIIAEQTPVANNGDIVVALIDDEATVKTFYKENGHFRLQPENDIFEPIIVDEVVILGKVVALMRYY